MTKKEVVNHIIEIAHHSSLFDVDKIAEWILANWEPKNASNK